MAAKDVGYDPNRSQVGEDKLRDFIQRPITGDLSEVPGVGPKAIERLRENDITTTYQLIGKYLSLKAENVQPAEHCDRFWYFLQGIHIDSHRAGIVQCIALKVDAMFPGIYDPALYE